eukprot:gnl/TRDRNA2_/TRDRNA2_125915_c3_seq4.p1 gnl/TRDRNA2_/TRDRNA2_125915_c3~~gnl/TRDRNA2_/TRDRNA2_125915_c3_seq4.p1  ORF type:complete len:467 (+),score=78.37 gnl/TRDRNA2_/TRDRNA2_125915_c3_seq4:53-1453(+)
MPETLSEQLLQEAVFRKECYCRTRVVHVVLLLGTAGLTSLFCSLRHPLTAQEPSVELVQPTGARQFTRQPAPSSQPGGRWHWRAAVPTRCGHSVARSIKSRLIPSAQGDGREAFRGQLTIAEGGTDNFLTLDVAKMGPAEMLTPRGQIAQCKLKETPDQFDVQVEEDLYFLLEQREEDERQQREQNRSDHQTLDNSALGPLRKRIYEVRRNERILGVAEFMYLMVCRRFAETQVPMMSTMKGGGDVRFGVVDIRHLTTNMYSEDTWNCVVQVVLAQLEPMKEQLFEVGGKFVGIGNTAMVPVPLSDAGQWYATAAVTGYSLRKLESRFQLEKTVGSFGARGSPEFGSLSDYISIMEPEMLYTMHSVSSLEAQKAIEMQVSALFGDLMMLKEKFAEVLGTVSSQEESIMKLTEAINNNVVETITIAVDDVTRLVLEGVAFGVLIYEAEHRIDAIYPLTHDVASPSGP